MGVGRGVCDRLVDSGSPPSLTLPLKGGGDRRLFVSAAAFVIGAHSLDQIARSGAARTRHFLLDPRAGSRGSRAARLHDGGRGVASAGRLATIDPKLLASCSPTRTSASHPSRESIRWRRARCVAGGQPWARGVRRLDADHAARAPAGAERAHARGRQAVGDGPRVADRAAAAQGRDPLGSTSPSRPMAAIWKACAPPAWPISARSRAPERCGSRAAGRLAAVAGDRAARPLPAGGAEARDKVLGVGTARRDRRGRTCGGAGRAGPAGAQANSALSAPHLADAVDAAEPGASSHPHHARRRSAARLDQDRAALSESPSGAQRHHRRPRSRE